MPELTELSEEARQRALERFRVLQPHLEEGRALTEVARAAGVPYRTAKRWVALYRQFCLTALARKGRAARGGRRALSSVEPLEDEAITAIVRVTGGNFRLLHQILTQMERILEINKLNRVTGAVVEAAR